MKMFGYLSMGAIIAVLSLALWTTNHRLDKAHEKIGTQKEQIAQVEAKLKDTKAKAKKVNEANLATIQTCQETNAKNTAQREEAKAKAANAVAKAHGFEKQLSIMRQKYEIATTERRTLDDPLPDSLTGWLCEPAVNCLDRNQAGDSDAGENRASAGRTDQASAHSTANPSTRQLANVYRKTVGSMMICNNRLEQISHLGATQ